jgi:glutathione peroxidase
MCKDLYKASTKPSNLKTHHMKKTILTIAFTLVITLTLTAQKSFYDIPVKTLEGKTFTLNELKGHKVMVVNTASKCSFTEQYEMLEVLYQKYKEDGLVILAFPSNSFGETEFEDTKEIRTFCTNKYEITFPIMEMATITEGKKHPVYEWLTAKALNGKMDSSVEWNFQKYLINEDGELEKVISSGTKPYDKEVISWIKG